MVKYWLSKWDGTLKSLESVSGGDHRSFLTDQEKKKYVDQYITKCSKKDAVQYLEVKKHIEKETGKSISLQHTKNWASKRANIKKSQAIT